MLLQRRRGRTNASVRLLADGFGLVAGLVAGIVTARFLGPEGKGLFAVITYATGVVAMLATLGVGEAEIFFVNRGRHLLKDVIPTALLSTASSGFLGGALLTVALLLYMPVDDLGAEVIMIAALTVPLSALATTVAQLHNISERFIFTSAINAAMSGSSAMLTWILLGPLDQGLTGALIATLLVTLVGVSPVLLLRGEAEHGQVRLDYAREACRFGSRLVVAGGLVLLAGRADLLVVDVLEGNAGAGLYSVALTVAALPTYGASALVFVAFPRLSRESAVGIEFTGRLCRMGILSALLASASLMVVVPVLVPFLFGKEFAGAVPVSMILLAGAPIWAVHLVLGRAAVAADQPTLLAKSYLSSLIAMLLLDALLIPGWGLTGAAIASAAAPISGLGILLAWYRRSGGDFRSLVPRLDDFRDPLRRHDSEVTAREGG